MFDCVEMAKSIGKFRLFLFGRPSKFMNMAFLGFLVRRMRSVSSGLSWEEELLVDLPCLLFCFETGKFSFFCKQCLVAVEL
jgi:hypothetical protein